MITYTEAINGAVNLEMTWEEYATLMMILGYATGAADGKVQRFWILNFVNELNRTNPKFTPYKV